MEFENLLISYPQQAVALIEINRPAKLNALNQITIASLSKAIAALEEDNAVRVVVLTGVGEKAFVAGADISEFSEYNKEEGEALSRKGHTSLFDALENLRKPVIAAINGFALGGGLELAMACHFRLASENAKMGLPEVSLGLIPGYGGTQRLPQLIGKGRALEMMLTGAMITAEKALSYGLVNHVVSQADLLATCLKIAERILQNSSNAASQVIKSVNAGYNNQVDGYAIEIEAFGACFGTDDFIEGTSAFLNKRKPKF